MLDEQLMQAIVRQVKIHTAEYIREFKDDILKSLRQQHKAQAPESVQESQSEFPDYLQQIFSAQEFLNEHRNADLFQVKCLLRTMLPKQYHNIIESLKEHQDPTIIYNINGGNNIIAPMAKIAQQNTLPPKKD